MRPRQCRDSVPSDLIEIQVFHTVAVDVDFIVAGKTLDTFGDASLSAMALIYKWRNNCNAGLRHGGGEVLGTDVRGLAPKLGFDDAAEPLHSLLLYLGPLNRSTLK